MYMVIYVMRSLFCHFGSNLINKPWWSRQVRREENLEGANACYGQACRWTVISRRKVRMTSSHHAQEYWRRWWTNDFCFLGNITYFLFWSIYKQNLSKQYPLDYAIHSCSHGSLNHSNHKLLSKTQLSSRLNLIFNSLTLITYPSLLKLS